MLTWERTLQESVSMKTLLCLFRKAWNTMWASYLFWRASWCNEPSWWNCEGQILWQLVRHLPCTSEQCKPISRQICVTTQRTRNLFWKRSRTEKEKEEKVTKQRYTMTFPTKEEVSFALRFETFDLPPYGKESSCNSKNILKSHASTKTGYRLPNVHTFWYNQVHIVMGGGVGDVSSASNDSIFPLHHFFVDRIYEKWPRKFNKNASVPSTYNSPIGHNKDNVIVSFYPVLSTVYSSTDVY